MISSAYKTIREHLDFGELKIAVDVVTNIDDLFSQLIGKGEEHPDVKDERIPYWADLWPSAIALSKYIVQSGLVKSGTKVLEIGCGLGLPGIVAGKLGAEVTFTDYLPEPLAFAEHNWKLNAGKDATFRLLDWRNPDPSFAGEIVLAADVAYERKSFDHLINAFRNLIAPGGSLLIAEPNRTFAQSFFSDLPNLGFQVKKTGFVIERREIKSNVNVYSLERSSNR